MESETYDGRYIAVLVNEDDDSETIVTGMCLNDDEESLTLAYYLRKLPNGAAAKEVTINKDDIREVVVLIPDRKVANDNPQQLQLNFDAPTQTLVAEAAA